MQRSDDTTHRIGAHTTGATRRRSDGFMLKSEIASNGEIRMNGPPTSQGCDTDCHRSATLRHAGSRLAMRRRQRNHHDA